MIRFRPGSHAYILLSVLSVAGEYPFRSLSLLGKEKVMQQLVLKLATVQTIQNLSTGEEVTLTAVQILSRHPLRTIRLTAEAAPVLRWLDAEVDYENAFPGAKLANDRNHRERNHRVAEAVAMCAVSGIEYRPHLLPAFHSDWQSSNLPELPLFYLSRAVKEAGDCNLKKIGYSRIVGALLMGGVGYAAYNTRDACMRWTGMGEQKALYILQDVLRRNFAIPEINSAVLFGASEKIALQSVMNLQQFSRQQTQLNPIYQHVHFVPGNDCGKRFLKIMALANWKERLLQLSFADKTRVYNRGSFEYDAFVNGVYYLSHLDSDLMRLYRFREAAKVIPGKFAVLCYSYQVSFLRELLGPEIALKAFPMETVEKLLLVFQDDDF